jgi:peptidoglycan/LPS O-acetylase OafA/YrhL
MSDRRLNGLDTLRSAAILLVFMNHYYGFVSDNPTFGIFSVMGWAGVDLFFVLSGYLIGDQILSGLAGDRVLSLPAFYKRRLLRTLPNYWVMLALYFAFPAFMGGRPPPPLWRFLTFTQNFFLAPGTAFSHAWSLCVEEQFYLLLPLLCLLFVKTGRSRAAAWITFALLVAVGVSARWYYWLHYGTAVPGAAYVRAPYYGRVYYGSISRFDEFLPGVAIAFTQNFHPAAWQRITARGNVWLALGVAAICGMGILFDGYFTQGQGYSFAATAFGYSLVALSFGLLVLAALSPGSLLDRLRLPGATHLALWSYAFYLVHKPIIVILRRDLPESWDSDSPRTVVLMFAASLLGSWLLYRLVETPFMRLRKTIAPSNFAGAILRPEPTSDPAAAHS